MLRVFTGVDRADLRNSATEARPRGGGRHKTPPWPAAAGATMRGPLQGPVPVAGPDAEHGGPGRRCSRMAGDLHLAPFCWPAPKTRHSRSGTRPGDAPPHLPPYRGIMARGPRSASPGTTAAPHLRVAHLELGLAGLRAQRVGLLDPSCCWIRDAGPTDSSGARAQARGSRAAAGAFARSASGPGHDASATTTGASTPPRSRRYSRSGTSTRCSTARVGRPGSR